MVYFKIAHNGAEIYMRIWLQSAPYDKSYFKGYALLGAAYIGLSITNTV